MTFHHIYKRPYSSWEQLEQAIEALPGKKEKGDAFEQLAFAYFTYHRDIYQIRELYMGPDIPPELKSRYRLEKKDSGVDGLFLREDGGSTAYQVKFRSGGEAPSYDDLTSFWAESEHTSQRCVFANCYTLPRQAYKKKDQFTVLRDSLTALGEDFFAWLHRFAGGEDASARRERFVPRPHQARMIRETLEGFAQADRGKLLAACGTGKTLTALWIREGLEARITLFTAPSLALIKQTLEAWMPQAAQPFRYLCVCSDETVAPREAEDDFGPDLSAINVPVTTDWERIREFLSAPVQKDRVIFSTYQSLDALVLAVQDLPGFSFDLAIFDEAHRTAGNKDSAMFVYGMEDAFLPCKKRLFMTATERFVNPHIAGRAKQLRYEVFSMDNEEQYGRTFTALPFREAIEAGIISDYRIVLCCMREGELKQMIRDNQIIRLGDRQVDAKALFLQVLLARAMEGAGIRKVVSYHRSIRAAKEFIAPEDGAPIGEVIASLSERIQPADVFAGHINGAMSAGARREILHAFVQAPWGILSNARCLTEGVDLPIIDGVYFAGAKSSVVDIIQAVGRSLRREPGKPDKVSYIIVPMVIPDSVTRFADIDPQEFATLHAVIQALRDQDRILADSIDKLNLQAARGRDRLVPDPDMPLLVELSRELDLEDFSQGLALRVAQVNKDPDHISQEFIVTRASRASGVKRTFRTVGDYNPDTYVQNLILPTLARYGSLSAGLPREAVAIGHNNVSHCVKLGILEERDLRFFVTDVGRAFWEYRELSNDIFREQLLKYYELDTLTRAPKFPYRMALRVIAALGSVTRLEFVCSLYTGRRFGPQGEAEALERVRYLRESYPGIEILSEANKRVVLDALNAKFDTTLTFDDIWTTRTTVGNQFNYIKNHLLAWDTVFDRAAPRNVIALREGGAQEAARLLELSAEIERCPLDSLRKHFTQYKGW